MRRPYRSLWAAIALALAALTAGSRGAAAADPGALVVIVDGSGSMWATMEGTRQTRLVLAREALRRGLSKLSPQARVGLTMFGHRRGDCSDVEVVRQPGPLDVGQFIAPLEQLNPRGRGPITLSVREAAKAFPKDATSRTLLLIHDDADNCQPDLCAAAAELKSAGIVAHVVGLGVKADDIAKMACLPQMTGGRHLNAQTGDQVGAYVEEALLLTASEMGGIEARPTALPATAIVPPSPIPASGPPALYLRALPAQNAEPLNVPMYWSVTPEGRLDVPLFGTRAVNPTVPVAPGRYVVEVSDGPVSAKQTVEVRENRPVTVAMMLNAGMARIRVLGRKNTEIFQDARVTVTDANGALQMAARTGETTALLPAGKHIVRAELGTARAEQQVAITAGRLFAVDIPFNAARLQLTTGLEAPVFSVLEDDPDAPDGRREIARSAAQPAEFVLAPGTYYAVARQGAVETRERIAIGPGDVVRRTLTAAAGSLALSTKPPPFGLGGEAYVSYTVSRIDGVPQDPITTSRPSPTLLLPTGRYRVEGRYGLMNVRTVRDIEVKTGQVQQLVFEHEAAALRLRVTGSGPTDVSWVIRDPAGKAVWTGANAEAVASLQAGRYIVRAETRNKREERPVDLKSGDARLLEFSVD